MAVQDGIRPTCQTVAAQDGIRSATCIELGAAARTAGMHRGTVTRQPNFRLAAWPAICLYPFAVSAI